MILFRPWRIILHHFHQGSYENERIKYPVKLAGAKLQAKPCPVNPVQTN
jgi:hypothetical protein